MKTKEERQGRIEMMTLQQIETATRDELADELGAACEPTEDWETADIEDLRRRVKELVALYTDD